jgi:hypothetical protein
VPLTVTVTVRGTRSMDIATPPTEPIDDNWCSIAEAARRLGVTPTAIRNRIKRGTLPTRPNGNFGKLVKVPRRTVTLTVPRTVTLTPDEPVRGTVTGTVEERVALTVTLTVLASHIEALQAALAKAEAAAERGRQAEAEAAAVPGLRDTIAALKAALDAEQARNRDLRRERDKRPGGLLQRLRTWAKRA